MYGIKELMKSLMKSYISRRIPVTSKEPLETISHFLIKDVLEGAGFGLFHVPFALLFNLPVPVAIKEVLDSYALIHIEQP